MLTCPPRPIAALAACLFFLLGGLPAYAQFTEVPKATEVVQWNAAAVVPPGDTLTVTLRAEIRDGWSMYAMDSPEGLPLSIEFPELPDRIERLRPPEQFDVTEGYDPNFDATVLYFKEESRAEARFLLHTTRRTEPLTLVGRITFMACSDSICLPPTTVPFDVQVEPRP